MTVWFIVGGAVVAAWALLSVVGSELARRKRELEYRFHHVRQREAAEGVPARR